LPALNRLYDSYKKERRGLGGPRNVIRRRFTVSTLSKRELPLHCLYSKLEYTDTLRKGKGRSQKIPSHKEHNCTMPPTGGAIKGNSAIPHGYMNPALRIKPENEICE